jgi:WD40 repeat protein
MWRKPFVAASPRDSRGKVWDLETGRELRTLEGHSSHVYGVAVTPDGKWAVSASYDYTLKVWDLEAASGRQGSHRKNEARPKELHAFAFALRISRTRFATIISSPGLS